MAALPPGLKALSESNRLHFGVTNCKHYEARARAAPSSAARARAIGAAEAQPPTGARLASRPRAPRVRRACVVTGAPQVVTSACKFQLFDKLSLPHLLPPSSVLLSLLRRVLPRKRRGNAADGGGGRGGWFGPNTAYDAKAVEREELELLRRRCVALSSQLGQMRVGEGVSSARIAALEGQLKELSSQLEAARKRARHLSLGGIDMPDVSGGKGRRSEAEMRRLRDENDALRADKARLEALTASLRRGGLDPDALSAAIDEHEAELTADRLRNRTDEARRVRAARSGGGGAGAEGGSRPAARPLLLRLLPRWPPWAAQAATPPPLGASAGSILRHARSRARADRQSSLLGFIPIPWAGGRADSPGVPLTPPPAPSPASGSPTVSQSPPSAAPARAGRSDSPTTRHQSQGGAQPFWARWFGRRPRGQCQEAGVAAVSRSTAAT